MMAATTITATITATTINCLQYELVLSHAMEMNQTFPTVNQAHAVVTVMEK